MTSEGGDVDHLVTLCVLIRIETDERKEEVATSDLDPRALADLLFPLPEPIELQAGDACVLDGDPRPHRIASISGDTAVVHLEAYPSATYRRVRLDDCIPLGEGDAA